MRTGLLPCFHSPLRNSVKRPRRRAARHAWPTSTLPTTYLVNATSEGLASHLRASCTSLCDGTGVACALLTTSHVFACSTRTCRAHAHRRLLTLGLLAARMAAAPAAAAASIRLRLPRLGAMHCLYGLTPLKIEGCSTMTAPSSKYRLINEKAPCLSYQAEKAKREIWGERQWEEAMRHCTLAPRDTCAVTRRCCLHRIGCVIRLLERPSLHSNGAPLCLTCTHSV